MGSKSMEFLPCNRSELKRKRWCEYRDIGISHSNKLYALWLLLLYLCKPTLSSFCTSHHHAVCSCAFKLTQNKTSLLLSLSPSRCLQIIAYDVNKKWQQHVLQLPENNRIHLIHWFSNSIQSFSSFDIIKCDPVALTLAFNNQRNKPLRKIHIQIRCCSQRTIQWVIRRT